MMQDIERANERSEGEKELNRELQSDQGKRDAKLHKMQKRLIALKLDLKDSKRKE